MEKAIPLFTSDHSICESTLTISKDIYKKLEEEQDGRIVTRETTDVEITYPVSIFAIAKIHGINPICFVESSMSGFWEIYNVARELKQEYIFGYKVKVCSNMAQKDEASIFTESNVIVFLKNSDGYQDLIKISSKASTDGFYYVPRIDWITLNKLWTDNLYLGIPFYSSFLAKNLLRLKYCAFPNFDKINEIVFFDQDQGLPFDQVISRTVKNYCKVNEYPIQKAHSIYYYNDEDVDACQVLKCINNRSNITDPKLNHFGSNQFSFETFKRKYL